MNCAVATLLAEQDFELELEKAVEANRKTEKFRMARRKHVPGGRRPRALEGMHHRRIKNVQW